MLENARFHHIGFAVNDIEKVKPEYVACLLYTSPSPRD